MSKICADVKKVPKYLTFTSEINFFEIFAALCQTSKLSNISLKLLSFSRSKEKSIYKYSNDMLA